MCVQKLTELFDNVFFVTLVCGFDVFGVVRLGVRLVRFAFNPQIQRLCLDFTDHRDGCKRILLPIHTIIRTATKYKTFAI